MSYFQKSELPCWDCGGSSSVTYYAEPAKERFYCHRCDETLFQKNNPQLFEEHYTTTVIRSFKGKSIMMDNTVKQYMPKPPTDAAAFPQRGVINELKHRHLKRETCEKYSVETLYDATGESVVGYSFPGFDADRTMISQKVKNAKDPSKMVCLGERNRTTMFGMQAFPEGGKYLTITEGEEDAMSVYQMLKEKSPAFEPVVVSVKDGAGPAEKDCKNNYEFIDSFENIILCFDGDAPGQKAAEKVAQLFPHKVKIVKFTEAVQDPETKKWAFKDANDYLKSGRNSDFIRMWYQAEKYAPKGVLTFRSLWEAMTSTDKYLTVPYPWEGLNKKLYGMRTGEMVVWKAFPKNGKTLLFRHLIHHIITTTEHNAGVIMLEDTKKSIGLGFCAIEMARPIHIPEIPFSMDELKTTYEKISEGDRITIFDPEDSRTAENIFKKIKFFVKAHNCKFIFLDHASMLAYQSEDMDERKFLDKLFADLKEMTTALDIHLSVIVHVNDDGKTRGSRSPVQLCNALIYLDRDKMNDDPIIANTTEVIVEENRISGDSGTACKLFYDKNTGLLKEMKNLDTPTTEKETVRREVIFDD